MIKIIKNIVIALITLVTICLIYIWIQTSKYENLIYPGVYIDGVDVGGDTKLEAEKKLSKYFEEFNRNKEININIDGKVYKSTFGELCIKVSEDEVIKEAHKYGKDFNIIKKYKLIKLDNTYKLYSSVSIDEECFNKFISKIEKEVNIPSVNALIEHIEGRGFVVTPHKVGKFLDREELRNKILDEVNKKEKTNEIELIIELKEKLPSIIDEELKTVNTLIASYTTSFSNSSFARGRNIEIATRYINGYVLMSGEEFSFNKVVGRTSREKGYESAKAIVGGEFVDDIGGGVCQVSSTLYNTILKTELKVSERRNHSKPIKYVPLGQDAMIFYGYSDFKFINTYDFPIYIEGKIINNTVTFKLYCNSDAAGKAYVVKTPIVKTIPPKIRFIYDHNLRNGETIIEENGKNGYMLETYRETYENGKLINKELISKSKYNEKDQIIRKGR